MKQTETGRQAPSHSLNSNASDPCPTRRGLRMPFMNNSKHIFKKRPRPIHKRNTLTPKMTEQISTSASTIDLQTQTLPISQSQQCEGQIQFSKALETTLQHLAYQWPASALSHQQVQHPQKEPEMGEAGDVTAYLHSIGQHLFRQQARFPMPALLYSGCFDHQTRISNLHLMFGFCVRYGFKVETIFLAFSIYHRVAFSPEFQKHSLSLQAIASLFVAAKYEEIAVPKAQVFARCDPLHKVAAEDVLRVESEILLHLNFNLSFPTVLQFIDLLRIRFGLERGIRDQLISVCYKSLNSLALWQDRGSMLAMSCLHFLQPQLELGQSKNEDLNAELKWRVAELLKVGAAAHGHS